MNKILIIEDELKMSEMLKKAFQKEDFAVDAAYDGFTGKKMALEVKYDAIILDINLPMINGYEVCREIRKNKIDTPVIMLTAAGYLENKLNGFDAGADDYVVKPFEFKELLARLRVFLKRTNTLRDEDVILRIADLEMNLDSKVVKRSDHLIPLTVKEFALLEVLMRNKGRIVSKAELAEKVWELSFSTGTNIIEVCVNYVRKKVDKDFPVKLIHTAVGMGYIMKDEQ